MAIPLAAGERSRTYALGGVARGGITRAGYVSPQTFVAIDGVQRATGHVGDAQVDNDTLSISEVLDETPNTARFTTRGFRPANGANVVMTQGSRNRIRRLFAGTVLAAAYRSIGVPSNARYAVSVIDYAWQLTWIRIRKRYTNQSVTAIALDLLTFAPPGFDGKYVAAGLEVLDEFTVTDEDLMTALVRLAARISGHVKVDYDKHVHLPTFAAGTNPTTLVEGLSTLTIESVHAKWDLGQVITRVTVEGGGVTALTEVAPGETILPVDDVSWYEASNGQVVSGPQPAISYTEAHPGGAGTIVGPGAAPSVAPTVTAVSGSGLGTGWYGYGFTDVTAGGESLPSPRATVQTTSAVTDPTTAPTKANVPNGGTFNSFTPIGETQLFEYTYSTKTSLIDFTEQTLPSGTVANTTVSNGDPLNPTRSAPVRITVPYSTNPVVKSIHIYLKSAESGGVVFRLASSVSNNPVGGSVAVDTTGTTAGSPAAPGSNTSAAGRQVAISAVALGATGTTQRKVYRTVAQTTQALALSAQLKLQQTIANNTATVGVQDATADGSLGANVPTSDTSGLTQPFGQVNPGATSIPTAGVGSFPSSGYVITPAGDLVRYTGISGMDLTGIPASGPGALLTVIFYNDPIVPAPMLSGIPATGDGAITQTIKHKDNVNLLVQVDDLVAQATLAAVIGGGFDGVITEPVQDRRLSVAECRARGEAVLALRALEEVGLTYESRDVNNTAGRDITSALSAPLPAGTFTQQSVEISGFTPARPAHYQIDAVITRFTFEALLKLARGRP